jgi:hypothetical protein
MFYKGELDGLLAKIIGELPLMPAAGIGWISVAIISIHRRVSASGSYFASTC